MSNTHLDRAKILTEALPYIQRYDSLKGKASFSMPPETAPG